MGGNHHHHNGRKIGPPDHEALKRLRGYQAREEEATIGSAKWDAEVERALEIGLPGAESIDDSSISTFSMPIRSLCGVPSGKNGSLISGLPFPT